MRVFVYFNIRARQWSVRALEGPNKGRVIHRSRTVVLSDVTPKVSEAGRQRVLRERRKNVHAGLVGTLVSIGGEAEWSHLTLAKSSMTSDVIRYNPYHGRTFYTDLGGKKWDFVFAPSVVLGYILGGTFVEAYNAQFRDPVTSE